MSFHAPASNHPALYNPLALVDLNFQTGTYVKSGTAYALGSLPGWTFTRTTTGYGANAAGALTNFAIDAPRITDQGLLVEAAATNLFLRSNDFANATWAKINVTVTAGAGPSPTGATDASRLELTATFASFLYQSAPAPADTYVMSIWVARNTGSDQSFNLFNDAGPGTSAKTATATMQRLTLSGASAGGGTAGISNGGPTADLLAFGAQIETGTTPSSYIETAGATATRGADVASITFTGGTLATIVYGGGLIATVAVTTSLDLGASSGGPWVGSYIERVVVR